MVLAKSLILMVRHFLDSIKEVLGMALENLHELTESNLKEYGYRENLKKMLLSK